MAEITMSGHWPSWRYHASEPKGRIFERLEDVPFGWVQSPADIGKEPEAPEPIDFSGLSDDELKEIAAKGGVKIDGRWKRARIEQALREAQ